MTKKARAKHRRLNYLYRRESKEGPRQEIPPAAGEGHLDPPAEHGGAVDVEEPTPLDEIEGDSENRRLGTDSE